MSLEIEKQSLLTLREWTKLLGIKGVSTLKKPELIDLLTRVGESRIEMALRMKQESEAEKAVEAEKAPEESGDEAAEAEAEPKAEEETEEKAEEEKPEERPRSRWTSFSTKNINRAGEASRRPIGERRLPPLGGRPPLPANGRSMPAPPILPQPAKAEPLIQPMASPVNDAPEDNSEIAEPEAGTAARPRRPYNYFGNDTGNRFINRSGFGTYAPSYRAQTEERLKEREEQAGRGLSADAERPVPPDFAGAALKEKFSEVRRERREAYDEEPEQAGAEELPLAEEKEPEAERGNIPNVPLGDPAHGILEVMPDGYGFIRCENFLPGENDVYVAPSQVHRFNLKTGHVITGVTKAKTGSEKYPALLYINAVNDEPPAAAASRRAFEDLTPIFPQERIHLETEAEERSMRLMDLVAPIGKGQRGMIVSPPKAGKTTLIKQIAKATTQNHPDMHLIILLIDERPEEVTDIKEYIEGPNVEVIYSTFDETPEHHKRVAEMVLGRAQRLVEHGRDVMILLDSITRLARAYNLTVAPSGRTLSGGLDPAALHMPKKFFGAARNTREGGSLTVLATALVDTGSRLDDMVFEEFKGTGNMELVLDRKLSERRIFPAMDILRSGTRRDDLLLTKEEQEIMALLRQAISSPQKGEEYLEKMMDLMKHTKNNREFLPLARKMCQ